ncbi:MAG TPA: cysteine peptidase family C39 domain-containing protein, partial [Planctomycetia bacterium]|nr:cysteine peptidase family C39 domain-containing protein [Planctomycetia bacterium]
MFGRRNWACVRGNDENDCGPAALATLARQHGRKVSLERLREVCGTDRAGTSLLGLRTAAERLGFAARCVQASPESLEALPLPALAHVKRADGRGHYVTLHQVTKRGVIYADPAEGIMRKPRAGFEAEWTGVTMLAAPLDDVEVTADDGAAPPTALKRLFRLLAPHGALLG